MCSLWFLNYYVFRLNVYIRGEVFNFRVVFLELDLYVSEFEL